MLRPVHPRIQFWQDHSKLPGLLHLLDFQDLTLSLDTKSAILELMDYIIAFLSQRKCLPLTTSANGCVKLPPRRGPGRTRTLPYGFRKRTSGSEDRAHRSFAISKAKHARKIKRLLHFGHSCRQHQHLPLHRQPPSSDTNVPDCSPTPELRLPSKYRGIEVSLQHTLI